MIAEMNVNHSFPLKHDINTKSSNENEMVAVNELQGYYSPFDPMSGEHKSSDNYN